MKARDKSFPTYYLRYIGRAAEKERGAIAIAPLSPFLQPLSCLYLAELGAEFALDGVVNVVARHYRGG